MVEPAIFGPLDSILGPYIEWVVLAIVLVNLATRFLAHRRHVNQVDSGADAVDRFLPHEVSNMALVLAAFYFLTIEHHAGMVLATLVVGTVIADFFEFEARNVEARNEMGIELPKGAIVASMFVAAYAVYIALFFLIEGPLGAII